MTIHCGVRDGDGISPYYKAFLTQEIPNLGLVTVVGYISGDTSIELAQLWSSPFEGDTAGNAGGLDKASSLAQTQSGMTSKTLANGKLVWDGAEALEIPLTLQFVAHADAKIEVNDPIKYLMQMSSPELKDITPLGRIPQKVTLDLGRRLIANVFIKNVSYNESAAKTKQGYFTHNEIVLQLSLDGAVNASKIPSIFK